MNLIIPELPKSLNELLGMNHWARNSYKKETSELIGWLCKGLKPIIKPVKIHYKLTFDKKRKRDLDNYIGGTKYFNDALKDAGIIPDDNSEIITQISIEFVQGTKKETEITFYE